MVTNITQTCQDLIFNLNFKQTDGQNQNAMMTRDKKKCIVTSIFILTGSLLGGCTSLNNQIFECSGNLNPQKLYKNTKDSIAVIQSESQQGSGFVVSHQNGNTYILTNSHVINEDSEVTVKWENRLVDKGFVVGDLGGYGLSNDLALIEVNGKRGKPIKLNNQPPKIGSDVVVIGAPQGLEFSLTKGVVSQIREKGDFVQIDAPVNPGNSGGPLIDSSGCAVGVVTFKKEDAEGLNFAISAHIANKFIEEPILAKLDSNEPILQAKTAAFPEELPKVPEFKNTDSGAGAWITYFKRESEKDFYPSTIEVLKTTDPDIIKHWYSRQEYQKDTIVRDGEWLWVLTRNSKSFVQDQRSKIGNEDTFKYNVKGTHYGNTTLNGINCKLGFVFWPEQWWTTNSIEPGPGHSWYKKMGGVFYNERDIKKGQYQSYLFSDFGLNRYSETERNNNLVLSIARDRAMVSLYKTFCMQGAVIASSIQLSTEEQKISKQTNAEANSRSKELNKKVIEISALAKEHLTLVCRKREGEITRLNNEWKQNLYKVGKQWNLFWSDVRNTHGSQVNGSNSKPEDFPNIYKKYPAIIRYDEREQEEKLLLKEILHPRQSEFEEIAYMIDDEDFRKHLRNNSLMGFSSLGICDHYR